jgi:hypothetical protein
MIKLILIGCALSQLGQINEKLAQQQPQPPKQQIQVLKPLSNYERCKLYGGGVSCKYVKVN